MLNAASEQNNPFAGLMGQQSQASNNQVENPQQGTENRQPLPNPWSPQQPQPAAAAAGGVVPPAGPMPASPPTVGTPGTQQPAAGATPGFPNLGPGSFSMLQSFMQQMAEHPELVQNLMASPQINSMAQNIASDPNLLNMLQPNRMNNPEQIRQVAQQIMGNSQLQNMMQNPQVLNLQIYLISI